MLNDPMSVNQIPVPEGMLTPPAWLQSIAITQEEYDLLNPPEHHTMYIITNSPDGRLYLGKHLILQPGPTTTYMIGPGDEPGEYQIWLNMKENWQDRLVPINRFDTPQKAIDAMNRYNNTGFHHDWASDVFMVLGSYIRRDIGIHDTLMGILSVFGWKNDVRFQSLIQIAITFNAHKSEIDIPVPFREELMFLRKQNRNELVEYYASLYDLLVEWAFFKGPKYHKTDPDNLDLSEYIRRIGSIFIYARRLNLDYTVPS